MRARMAGPSGHASYHLQSGVYLLPGAGVPEVVDAGCSYESGSTLKTKSLRLQMATANTARTMNPLRMNEKLTSPWASKSLRMALTMKGTSEMPI